MATSTGLRGNVNPIFTLKIGAGSATSYSDDIKAIELSNDDKDDSDLTFYEAAQGTGVDWTLDVTAIVSDDAGSLFSYLWTNPGIDVQVVYGKWGNATPTATKPHYTFTMNTGPKPGFSTEAGTDLTRAEFEKSFKISTDITRVIA